MNLIDETNVYCIGSAIGYFTKSDVVKWADKQIEKMDAPPYEIIELSLDPHTKIYDVCADIRFSRDSSLNELAINIILGLLSFQLVETQDFKNTLYKLRKLRDQEVISDRCSYRWINAKIDFLCDDRYLAENDLYGTISNNNKEIKKFLFQFNIYANQYHSYFCPNQTVYDTSN